MIITKRQANPDDYDFLYDLKVSSMRNYVDQVYGWNDAVQKDFFDKDFRPDDMTIIQSDGKDVGMLEFSKDSEGYFLRRIEIHPYFQRQGIGAHILQGILSKAEDENVNVHLMVFKINPAQYLYERLGFKRVSETETHYKMIRQNKANAADANNRAAD